MNDERQSGGPWDQHLESMFHVRSSAEVKLVVTQSCTTALMPAAK